MARAFSSKRDVYLEIAERYEKYITLGVIKPGEKLPSVRTAAGELHVNPNTVQRAYTYLEERGFIRSMPKKGAYVIYGADGDAASDTLDVLAEELIRLRDGGISKEKILSLIEEVYKE